MCGVWLGGFKLHDLDDLDAGPNGCGFFALCVLYRVGDFYYFPCAKFCHVFHQMPRHVLVYGCV